MKIQHIHYSSQDNFSQVYQIKVSKIPLTFFQPDPRFLIERCLIG